MAETYFPFDSGAGSAVTEAQWYAMARKFIGSGVLRGELSEGLPYGDGSAMVVKVSPLQGWVEGHFYQSDALWTGSLAAADSINPRIDRVAVRLDRTARTVGLTVITGVVSGAPVPPALTQTATVWDIPIAQVRVNAGVTTIASSAVTDERGWANAAGGTEDPWHAVSWLNGWGNAPGFVTEYRMVGTRVYLRGMGRGGTVGPATPAFYVPVRYAPSQEVNISTFNGGTTVAQVQVLPTGAVTMLYGGNVWFNLDDVSWDTLA